MSRIAIAVLAILVLASCSDADDSGNSAPSAAAPVDSLVGPDIAACEAQQQDDPEAILPDQPVTVPPRFAAVAKASPRVLAVSTTSGSSACADLRWVSAIADMEWLQGDRLLGWSWDGYEAYGYQVVDRQGTGAVVETGVKPTVSPAGRRFASVQLSESGWGGLEGFAVWELHEDRVVRLGGELPDADYRSAPAFQDPDREFIGDWKVAGWSGDDCVTLKDIPYVPEDDRHDEAAARLFHASAAGAWRIRPGPCEGRV